MNASELREMFKNSRKTIVVNVEGFGDVNLRQLNVQDSLPITKLASGFQDASEPADMFRFWIELLSKCIVDDDGNKIFDDQEGREVLEGLRIDRITQLGNAAVELNGMTSDAKKN